MLCLIVLGWSNLICCSIRKSAMICKLITGSVSKAKDEAHQQGCMAVGGHCSGDDFYRSDVPAVLGTGFPDVFEMLHEKRTGTALHALVIAYIKFAVQRVTEECMLQVVALQKSPLIQTVTNNSLLRSAFRASETAGALMDDVLMSAMKSARKHMDADDTLK